MFIFKNHASLNAFYCKYLYRNWLDTANPRNITDQ